MSDELAIGRMREIEARLSARTPGYWVAGIDIEPPDGHYWDGGEVIAVDALPVPDYSYLDDEIAETISAWADEHCRGTVAETHNHYPIRDAEHDANQRLIAHAPADLRYLLDEVERLMLALGASNTEAEFLRATLIGVRDELKAGWSERAITQSLLSIEEAMG